MGAHDTRYDWENPRKTSVQFTADLTNVISAYSSVKKGRFLYISSQEVFGRSYIEDIKEDEPVSAANFRALALAQGEEICKSYYNTRGMQSIVVRMDNLYGTPKKGKKENNPCFKMTLEMLKNNKVSANSRNLFSMIHQNDAVQFLYQLVIAPKLEHSIYHISSGSIISQMQLAHMVSSAGGNGVEVVDDTVGNGYRLVLSGERFEKEFGRKIFVSYEEGVKKTVEYMKKHSRYYYSLLISCLIIMSSCQPKPSSLLKEAMKMEKVSTDSIFFYLQQIAHPRQLSLSEQGDYYLLSYKATLWKTGLPGDSLLRNALTCYKQSNLQAKWLQAHIEQSASYLYKNLPDSTLLSTGKLLKEYQLNDTLKTRIYGLRRAAYYRKQDYNQALAMADSSKQLTRKSKDTLAYFTANQLYLQIIEAMQQHEKYTQGYKKLIEELRDSPNHQSLIYYAFENLLNTSLERKDYRQALKYLQLLSNERRSRYEIPHYLLLRGRTYAALNQTDSAKYYYQQAATSTSEFIAMEANALLFNLINQEDYPEQAFYSKQKENTIKNNILGNINSEIQRREFNELKLQNELYQLHFQQQKHELWMLGIITALLSVGFIAFFFYQREKKERLQQENLLLHKEAELSGLREKEIRQRNKEAELREALFRRISFFHKLPSLHTDDKQDESAANSKIVVTNTEWAEVISVVNDAFDNFVVRLQQAYPSLGEKEIGFCCLVKINVNIQDLSDIYCISKAAITKRKYRIKTDKLGITDENISLDSFLKAF